VAPLSGSYITADPLVAISSLLYFRGEWIPVLLPPAVFLLISAVLGRVFCGWACPIGFLSDISSRINGRIMRKPIKRPFEGLHIGVLAGLLLVMLISPAVLSLADPMVVFQRSAYFALGITAIPVVIVLMILGSILVPRLWCRICPLGALLGAVSVFSPFRRRLGGQCTGCMKCRNACKIGAISTDNKWDAIACTRCLECERVCPVKAISFPASLPSVDFSPSRRSVIAAGAVIGFFAVSRSVASTFTARASPIRPPGSLVEAKFNAACIRCESCAKVCISQVIRPAGLDMGLERLYTPILDFDRAKCEQCWACGAACPTGAILSPPDNNMKIGTASIDDKKCLAWTKGKRCLICAEVCPAQAVMDADMLKPVISGDICVGCGACQYNCPVAGKAVTVTSAGERRRDE